ncbi:MASE3 domain-containing protein [Methanosarcina sp. UBA5]|uniref:MASE3 domain-containing protein n=1 Tax=Methanosarcina sp. UBA5 TaxID=1915593 RepID=UPI0025EE2A6C|nr:MASE3 domain-containing protein [Methanosarcina sp. UBA5]
MNISDVRENALKVDFYELIIWITIIILLYLISLNNYLLFHIVIELFSAYFAYVIFLIVWKSRSRLENRYLLILGVGYFFVGSFDFLSALEFHGMRMFPGFDANLTAQLWIAARFLESTSFLVASLFLIRTGESQEKKVKTLESSIFAWKTFLVYAVISVTCLISIFFSQNFPDFYFRGSGFTQFKVASGYLISFMLLCSLFLLYIVRDKFEEKVFSLLSISLVLTGVVALSFTFHSQMGEAMGITSLFFKLLSIYLIYKAIVDIGFEEPCSLLFRELKYREEDFRQKAVFFGEEYNHICRMIGKRYLTAHRSAEEKDYPENYPDSYNSYMQNLQGIGFQLNKDFKLIFLHGPVEEMTGYPKQDFLSGKFEWQEIIIPEDCPVLFKKREKLKLNLNFIVESEYRIQKKDGEIKWVREIIQKISGDSKSSGKFQGLVYDITERKMAEAALEKIDKIRVKEVHHRIKNNLQVISSLLSLQAEKFEDQEVLEAFRESQNRVASIAMIHEELHESESMDAFDFSDYLRKLTADLFSSYNVGNRNINLKLNLEQVYLDMNTAIPLGIIVNEIVSNALKHAFPAGKGGEISINFYRTETLAAKYGMSSQDKDCSEGDDCTDCEDCINNNFRYILTVADKGKGIPEEIDFQNTDSLGLQLVKILVEQIGGFVELKRSQGTKYIICFSNEER